MGKEDPFIRPGDIVIVTEGEPIYITGAVVAPQPIVMKDGMTLARALAMAGGPVRQAKIKEIHVFRQREGKIGSDDLKFDYEAIRKGKSEDIPLQAYDIIDVRLLGTFAPKNLADFFLNSVKGTAGFLPRRVLY
jgi:polysaccharide export outer membrane protein